MPLSILCGLVGGLLIFLIVPWEKHERAKGSRDIGTSSLGVCLAEIALPITASQTILGKIPSTEKEQRLVPV